MSLGVSCNVWHFALDACYKMYPFLYLCYIWSLGFFGTKESCCLVCNCFLASGDVASKVVIERRTESVVAFYKGSGDFYLGYLTLRVLFSCAVLYQYTKLVEMLTFRYTVGLQSSRWIVLLLCLNMFGNSGLTSDIHEMWQVYMVVNAPM